MPRTAAKRPVGRPRKATNARKKTIFERILDDDADDTRVDETLDQRHETSRGVPKNRRARGYPAPGE